MSNSTTSNDRHNRFTDLLQVRAPSAVTYIDDQCFPRRATHIDTVFDYYRQDTDPYDHHWSSLDLSITVGHEKPRHQDDPVRSFTDAHQLHRLKCLYGNVIGSALWRLRSALMQPDGVREISFEGTVVAFAITKWVASGWDSEADVDTPATGTFVTFALRLGTTRAGLQASRVGLIVGSLRSPWNWLGDGHPMRVGGRTMRFSTFG